MSAGISGAWELMRPPFRLFNLLFLFSIRNLDQYPRVENRNSTHHKQILDPPLARIL